jgi:hypothetical protein
LNHATEVLGFTQISGKDALPKLPSGRFLRILRFPVIRPRRGERPLTAQTACVAFPARSGHTTSLKATSASHPKPPQPIPKAAIRSNQLNRLLLEVQISVRKHQC